MYQKRKRMGGGRGVGAGGGTVSESDSERGNSTCCLHPRFTRQNSIIPPSGTVERTKEGGEKGAQAETSGGRPSRWSFSRGFGPRPETLWPGCVARTCKRTKFEATSLAVARGASIQATANPNVRRNE